MPGRSLVFGGVRLRWRLAGLLAVTLLFALGTWCVGLSAGQQGRSVELPDDLNVEDLLKPDPFTYDPTGKRDPFRSLTESRDWEVTTKVGLERFDLSELRLTGIVVGELGRFAMVEAPDKLTYFVGVGGPIGMNEGKIVQVDKSSVTVEEPYTDDFGNAAIRRVILSLE